MTTPTEFYKFWIVDELTGKLRKTTYRMTRATAAERYPGAGPDLLSREVRHLHAPALPFDHHDRGSEGSPCVCNPEGAVQWQHIYAEVPSDKPPH